MKKLIIILLAMVCLQLTGCGNTRKTPKIQGHYTYQHAFNYDMDGTHLEVSETGTMDFYPDGTALDSAQQLYTATFANGDTATWVYNYISPSRWRLEDEDLYFAGIKDDFRMEVVGENKEPELAQKIIDTYCSGIDYEYKFHLDQLTADLLQWSFTYRDGHSDTWTFYK